MSREIDTVRLWGRWVDSHGEDEPGRTVFRPFALAARSEPPGADSTSLRSINEPSPTAPRRNPSAAPSPAHPRQIGPG
jgi:hypothetical protein